MNNNRTALIKIKVKNILYWWMSLHRRVLLQNGGADLFQTQLSGFHLKVKRMLSSDLFPWSWVWKHCFVKEPDIQIWMMLFVVEMMKSKLRSCHLPWWWRTSPWYGFTNERSLSSLTPRHFFAWRGVGSTSLCSARCGLISPGICHEKWGSELLRRNRGTWREKVLRFFINRIE